MTICPCCGGETDRPTLESLQWVTMTAFERGIVDLLIAKHPRRLSGEQIAAWMYRDREDGGPLAARKAIDVYLHRIRKKIANTGWWVGRTGYGEGIGLHFVGTKAVAPVHAVKRLLSKPVRSAGRLSA